MRNANKSPKIPYSAMVREMEKWPYRILDRSSTSIELVHVSAILLTGQSQHQSRNLFGGGKHFKVMCDQ